jgi:hypothetical protein
MSDIKVEIGVDTPLKEENLSPKKQPTIIPTHDTIISQNQDTKMLFEHEMKVNYLVDKLKVIVSGNVNQNTIIFIITQAMLTMSEFKRLKGAQKKYIVIQAIKRLINSSGDLDMETKQSLVLLIDTVAPSLIDTFVWIGNQKIKFNKKLSKLCNCFNKPDPV